MVAICAEYQHPGRASLVQRTLFHLIKGTEDLGGRTLSKVFPRYFLGIWSTDLVCEVFSIACFLRAWILKMFSSLKSEHCRHSLEFGFSFHERLFTKLRQSHG